MDAKPVAIVLAPIDQGTRNVGGREGSAEAPRRILDTLLARGVLPKEVVVHEPVIENTAGSLEDDLARLRAAVADALAAECSPIVLGGDHGTTYATVRGLCDALTGPAGVAYLDAHFDMRPFTPAHTSGSSFRRLIEEGVVAAERVHPLGIVRPEDEAALQRSGFEELAGWADEHDVPWSSMARVREEGLSRVLEARLTPPGPWCLSFDVDCLDARWAPGVSAPGPGRFTRDEVAEAVARVAPRVDVFDVVEYVPRLDEKGVTLESVVVVVEALLRGRRLS